MLDGKIGYASASGGVDASGAEPEAGPAVRADPEAAPGTVLDVARVVLGVGFVAGPEVGLGATGPTAEPRAGPDAGMATGSGADPAVGPDAGSAEDPDAAPAVGPTSGPAAEPEENPEATTLPSSPRIGAGAGISSPSKTSSRVVNSSASTVGLNLSSSRFRLSALIAPPFGPP